MARKSLFQHYCFGVLLAATVSPLTFVATRVCLADTPDRGEGHVKAEQGKGHSEAHVQNPRVEVTHAEASPDTHVPSFSARVWDRYKTLFTDLRSKVVELEHADQENQILHQENAVLRLALESRDFECRSKVAAQRTQEYGSKLEGETGVMIGRTLASIQYEIPTQIQPALLHTLAVTYFTAGEDEKAAKIIHFLLGLENSEFRTPKNILMAGILWYRLDNIKIADALFGELLEHSGKEPVSASIQSQARLWRALAARKKGDRGRSQELLQDLLNHQPHSTEAAWVNQSKEATRVPASEP